MSVAPSAAASPTRWLGLRACTGAMARDAAVGSVIMGATMYVIGSGISHDRTRVAQGVLIGRAGGVAVGALFALEDTPCSPWN